MMLTARRISGNRVVGIHVVFLLAFHIGHASILPRLPLQIFPSGRGTVRVGNARTFVLSIVVHRECTAQQDVPGSYYMTTLLTCPPSFNLCPLILHIFSSHIDAF